MTWIITEKRSNFAFSNFLFNSRYPIYTSGSKRHLSWRESHAREDPLQFHWTTMLNDCKGNHRFTPLGSVLHIYRAKMSAKAVSLPKHMIVPSATSARTYAVEAQSRDPDTTDEARLDSSAHTSIGKVYTNNVTPSTKTGSLRTFWARNTDNVFNTVYSKPHEKKKIQRRNIHNSQNDTTRRETIGAARYKCRRITSHMRPST